MDSQAETLRSRRLGAQIFFTSGFGEGNDGWTPSIPVKNVCRPTCAHKHTHPLRAERRSLFSSSHPLEIQFLIRAPALMNICSSGTPTARMSGVCFRTEVFLNARLAGDEQATRVKETFSPERVSAVGAARDIRPPASPPLVSSIMRGSSLRRVSERLPISAPYVREPPSLPP